jgi:hypothetical protein
VARTMTTTSRVMESCILEDYCFQNIRHIFAPV